MINFKIILISLIIVLLPFSPLLSLLLSILYILSIDRSRVSYSDIIPIIVFLVLLSFLAASRGIFETAKDDFSDYYKNYQAFSHGNIKALFEWGMGFEVGLPLINNIFSIISVEIKPRLLLFLHLLCINTLLFYFVLKLAKAINVKKLGIFLCYFFLFLGVTGISNLLRQSYASVFLCLAFIERRNLNIIIGSIFHLSTLFLYWLYDLIFTERKERTLLVIAISIFLVINGHFIKLVLTYIASFKFEAYLIGPKDGYSYFSVLSAYKEFILLCVMSGLNFKRGYNKYIFYSTLNLILIIFSLETFIPGLSLRLFHGSLVLLIGPALFLVLFSYNKYLPYILLLPLMFLKGLSFYNNKHDMALFNDKRIYYSTPFEYISFLDQNISNDKRDWKKLKYE
ncbi:hypothetical protein GNP64_07835 [Aliivibrio fischeri]|uniref:EpsG family protein n=1 Tax=Aliivibrio fischeri TaxID=668 RepID=UPI0012DA2BD7|nr:EpsG family protein [Aliivibrio fischeri]MUL05924.1 hypothetical protein [Aliivibrio fischeri]